MEDATIASNDAERVITRRYCLVYAQAEGCLLSWEDEGWRATRHPRRQSGTVDENRFGQSVYGAYRHRARSKTARYGDIGVGC